MLKPEEEPMKKSAALLTVTTCALSISLSVPTLALADAQTPIEQNEAGQPAGTTGADQVDNNAVPSMQASPDVTEREKTGTDGKTASEPTSPAVTPSTGSTPADSSAQDDRQKTTEPDTAENTDSEEKPSQAQGSASYIQPRQAEDPVSEPEGQSVQQPKNGWDEQRQHYFVNDAMLTSQKFQDTTSGSGSSWYYAKQDGSIAKDEIIRDAKNQEVWYYAGSDGALLSLKRFQFSGKWYFADQDCSLARDKFAYDPESDGWYWFDADGTMASNKDAFVPASNNDRSHGKWVRCGADGRLVKGEDYRVHEGTASWYYFDPVTGEMAKGFAFIPSNGGKWVFYDRVTGRMLYGEQAIDGSWYYLTPGTGAVDYEWAWIPTSRKWVYYEPVTGKMVHGERMVDGWPRYFDPYTGRVWSDSEIKGLLMRTVANSVGTHPDCPRELVAAGGDACPYGPCTAYVWWSFHHSGLDLFLMNNDFRTGWPHKVFDWYRARGRVDRNATYGDIVFFKDPGRWADQQGLSANHAGFVVSSNSKGLYVTSAMLGGIQTRFHSWSNVAGIVHPFYG